MKKTMQGFTFMEVMITSSVLALLGTLAAVNVFQSQKTVQLTRVIEPLVSDIKSQQAKAMASGSVGGTVPDAYGVRFEGVRYILFRGTTYNIADTANVIYELEPRVTVSQTQLPDASVVFARGSGEFVGYANGSDTVTIEHLDSHETKTVQFNQYGIITAIQ